MGSDYRKRARDFFVEQGRITSDFELVWADHNSPDYTHMSSSANYLLWMKVNGGRDLIIVSAIPPNLATSSEHSHPPEVVEIFGCIKGEFDLHADGLVIRMREGSKEQEIMPGVKHRVKAGNDWALIPIVIVNGGLYPPEQLHRR